MFNDKITRFNLDEVKQKTVLPEAALSLSLGEQVVRAKTTSGGAAFTITLPSVVEAAGQLYSITMVSRDAAKDITVEDLDGDAGLSDVVLDLAAEHVILLSDGYTWALIFDNR
jgi:hypothetical protein